MENGKNGLYVFPTGPANTPEPRATEEEINTLKEKIRLKALEHSRHELRYAFWRDAIYDISIVAALGMLTAVFLGHRGLAIAGSVVTILILLLQISIDKRWRHYAGFLSDLRLVEEMMVYHPIVTKNDIHKYEAQVWNALIGE